MPPSSTRCPVCNRSPDGQLDLSVPARSPCRHSTARLSVWRARAFAASRSGWRGLLLRFPAPCRVHQPGCATAAACRYTWFPPRSGASGVAEGIANRFPANPVDFVPQDRMQVPAWPSTTKWNFVCIRGPNPGWFSCAASSSPSALTASAWSFWTTVEERKSCIAPGSRRSLHLLLRELPFLCSGKQIKS